MQPQLKWNVIFSFIDDEISVDVLYCVSSYSLTKMTKDFTGTLTSKSWGFFSLAVQTAICLVRR